MYVQLSVQPVLSGMLGRPSIQIPCEQLSYLIDSGFTVPQIADVVGVSVRTIYQRMTEFGLSICAQYSDPSDDQLDSLISDIKMQFPMCGNRQVQGYLCSKGY